MLKMFLNQKAQMGETITWVVATVVILILIIVSAFIASQLGKLKSSTNVIQPSNQYDLFAENSLTSYLLTPGDTGEPIYYELASQGKFNSNNGDFANSTFKGLYGGYYDKGLYLGISGLPLQFTDNTYFGSVPASLGAGSISTGPMTYGNSPTNYQIDLGNGKYIGMILVSSHSS